MSVSYTTEIQGPLENVNDELLTAAIDQRFQKYLEQRKPLIHAPQLQLHLLSAAVDDRRLSAVLKLVLGGQINEAPVYSNARAQRTVGNHG